MIITAKLVAIGLSLALTAFTVSTIVLAVQKANLSNDLAEAKEKLDQLEQALSSTSTTTTTTTTTEQPVDPDSSSSTESSSSSSSSSSTDSSSSSSSSTDSSSSSSSTPDTSTEVTPSPTANPEEKIDYRLPSNVVPLHYDLYLHPDVETGNFTGQILISVDVVDTTDKIILHSHNLEISDVWLNGVGPTNHVKSYSFDLVREFLVIELAERLTPSAPTIGIIFSGKMLNKIVGLYSSSYVKPDNTRKSIATSKFEPTYARQAFPCFDEPALKATFDITLVYPKEGDYHALSNMDIFEEKNQGDFVEVYFNRSVAMSTYLTVFIVSDFKEKTVDIETKGIGEPFKMSVYATPEQIDKVDFSLDIGKKVIEYYIDYFQIAYPLPKLDMAAIPDFVSGAMETWGLVTYRETSLLYDETTSSTANKQRIASVIAHEFAHMWFGNLVTMQWWNDLWLNEGFASFIENKGVMAVFPEWKMLDQFIVGTLHGVLSLDATLGSHPIVQTVENPDQITEIFDTITYSKGSSIIRMLEDFLGETTFRTAVTNYLNEYAFKNAVTSDFLSEIDKLDLDYNVTEIMRTWTEQMGLPVVAVEKLSNTEYKLTQKRFLSNPNDYNVEHAASVFNYRWSIPITYTTSAQPNVVQRAWFYHDQSELRITVANTVDWIKFNHDQVGYYRVNYAEAQWQLLAKQLINDPSQLTIGDRASLLNDAFSLADSTQLPYEIALDMTAYLAKEEDYVPWSVAASKLTSLKRTLYYTPSYVDYKHYATELIEPIYERLTWNVGTDHLDNRLRVTALSAACSLGVEDCLIEASALFDKWLAKPEERPHPDIRETVYYYGMLNSGDQKRWEQVWELFISETDASEKSKLMYGLAAVQEPWLLKRYINLAWDERYVRGQDYFTCLQYIAANPVGESLVWEHVREYWNDLVARFGLNERYLGNLIPGITARFATQTKLEEMEYFFEQNPEAGAGAAGRVRALETVKNNIVWLAENLDKIDTWLKKRLEVVPEIA